MGNGKKSRRKPGARRYADYSQEMLNVAVDLVKSKTISSYDAEKQFGIPRRTILNKCRNDNIHDKAVGRPTKLTTEEETHIANVINVAAEFGCPLSLLDLRIVVHNYLEKNDRLYIFNDKIPGERWARSFLSRHNLTQRASQNVKRCRAAKTIPEMIDFYKHLEKSLEDIPPSNLLNFDETNLSDNPGASKAIFKRGVKHPERVINSTKSSVSIMFAGTADGVLLPPYVVYKAEHLWNRWCREGPPNSRYNRTNSGWFDMAMFDDWFESIVIPWAKALHGPKLVIGDNLSSHLSVNTIKLCHENNIRFVFLPKNATHLTQPLDLAFFGPMKREWRKILLQYKLSNADASSINKSHFPKLLNELMENIDMTKQSNLKSGFAAAGICPFNPSRVTKKIPDVTEDKKKIFDSSLLEFLKTNREVNKQVRNEKNTKLSIVAGKSVSTEDATIMSLMQVKSRKRKGSKDKLLPKRPKKENEGDSSKKFMSNSDIENMCPKQQKSDKRKTGNDNFFKDTYVEEIGIDEENGISQTDTSNSSKIKLLSDIKITENTALRCLKILKPLKLTRIEKDTDLFNKVTSNSHLDETNLPGDIVTHVETYGTLSNSDEESDKPKQKKKNMKRIRKRTKTLSMSSSVTTSLEMSLHSDSDILDVSFDDQLLDVSSPNVSFSDIVEQETDIDKIQKVKKKYTESDHNKLNITETNQDDTNKIETNQNQNNMCKNENDLEQKNVNMSNEKGPVVTDEKQDNTCKNEKKVKQDIINVPKTRNDQKILSNKTETDKEDDINKIETDQLQYNMNKTDEPKEDLANELDKHVQNKSSEKEMYNTGQTVLTRYYKGKSWKYYVGEIESVNIVAKCYTISYFKMIGKKKGDIKLIKAKRITDKDDVPEDSIVKLIDLLPIYGSPNQYQLQNDEDKMYFFL